MTGVECARVGSGGLGGRASGGEEKGVWEVEQVEGRRRECGK